MEASELYDICGQLALRRPSLEGARQLREVIALCAAEGCRQHKGTFGNLFSQVDFLCNRLKMKAQQKKAIQTARRHSNMPQPPTDDDWLYDLRAVTIFISAVFREDVPGALLQHLPVNLKPQPQILEINREYIRCIVRSFDETMIIADTEEGEIVVDYGNTEGGRDFTYLRKILREGMQLNLLDNSQTPTPDGSSKVVPRLIIVEPDFLVDISSLAACFTAYATHPLLYTVNRLKPYPNTQATLLGNFANAALDDIINATPQTNDQGLQFSHTLRRSFREQALRFCACQSFSAQQFKLDAERQMQNIRQAVNDLRPLLTSPLLEPSFVCEKLGLQGRVDLMTTDMHLLVEQKAGKNMKIERQSHDAHNLQREDHYVQLLLYYGILRYNFGKSDAQVDTRLLYSRYESARGLVSVNYYRTLFREAIRLRNQVVALELLTARDGFGRIMPLLHADTIYKNATRDGFFHRYILPDIEALSSLFASLTPLERAYYERMQTFVYRELRAQKLGSSEQTLHHSGGCASDLWLLPLSEKRDQGNILDDLRITHRKRSSEYGGYDIIQLQGHCEVCNFRRGDMVYLYHYKDQPDVRRSILYKGTLEDIGSDRLTVRLNDGQQNPDIFRPSVDDCWAVEHGGSDVAAAGQIRSLHQFIQASPERKALLLGQRAPRSRAGLPRKEARDHYGDILQRISQARDYFLLVGPPGSGKTSMALRYIVEDELSASDARHAILLMAYTNRAVDEICAMLCDAGTDFLRLGNEASCDPRYKDHLLTSRLSSLTFHLSTLSAYVSSVRIVVTTTSMLLSRPFIFQIKHFSLAVVDEASQILEPGLIGILSSDRIDRFVLIGDHKQLPAVVQQSEDDARVDDSILHAIGLRDCRQSLFQRFYNWEVSQGRTQFIGMLDHQGRMHPDVAQFANQNFYGSLLKPVPLAHQQETRLHYDAPSADRLDDLLKTHRTLFLPVTPDASEQQVPNAKQNKAEARLVASLISRIQRFYGERFDAAKTIGIIVPYRNQIAAIREELPASLASHISIDTVERYQGSQRDVIIYSFTISRLYQLDFLTANTFTADDGQTVDRKLNVALTRARCQTIMVGNPDVLRRNPLFRQLIETMHNS